MAGSKAITVTPESPDLLDRADRYWLETLAGGLLLNAVFPGSYLGKAVFVGGTILGLHRLARNP